MACGYCKHGRLGLGLIPDDWIDHDDILKPIKIPYCIKEKIIIKDIKCGDGHNISLDIDRRVYSWGLNQRGQCGQGHVLPINEPKIIEYIQEFVIDCIDCGYKHSYVKTVDKKHYLFGSNEYEKCITYNEETEIIRPFRVDQIIKSKCNPKEIIMIEPGYYNTIYALSMKIMDRFYDFFVEPEICVSLLVINFMLFFFGCHVILKIILYYFLTETFLRQIRKYVVFNYSSFDHVRTHIICSV